jgi:hypothetical protein
MGMSSQNPAKSHRVMGLVRRRIERGGEHLWRFQDFRDLPFSAVAQALSRLKREGTIERLSKGVYYRNRKTAFGKSKPNPAAIRNLASHRTPPFGFLNRRAQRGNIQSDRIRSLGDFAGQFFLQFRDGVPGGETCGILADRCHDSDDFPNRIVAF